MTSEQKQSKQDQPQFLDMEPCKTPQQQFRISAESPNRGEIVGGL